MNVKTKAKIAQAFEVTGVIIGIPLLAAFLLVTAPFMFIAKSVHSCDFSDMLVEVDGEDGVRRSCKTCGRELDDWK